MKAIFALEDGSVFHGAGFGAAAAFDLGPIQLSPGAAIELATKPGPEQKTHFLFEPGVTVGTRF